MLTKHNNDLKWIDLTFEAWFLLIFDFIWDSYTFKESNSVSNTCKERFQLEIQKDFQPIVINKGQLISKSLFVVFNFFQKTNKNKFELRYHSSKVEFVCLFFGRNVGLKKSFWLCLTFNKFKRHWLTPNNNDLKWIGLTFEARFFLIFYFIWDS